MKLVKAIKIVLKRFGPQKKKINKEKETDFNYPKT